MHHVNSGGDMTVTDRHVSNMKRASIKART
jgi:hypothetical protein